MPPILIRIDDYLLSDVGRMFLHTYHYQQRPLASPCPGVWYAEIQSEHTQDLLAISVADRLTYRERLLQYGVEGLANHPSVWTGSYSAYAPHHPLPTVAHAQILAQDLQNRHYLRSWYIPDTLIAQAATLEGAVIINQAAELFYHWIDEQQYRVRRNPDWIRQVEAEQLVKVSRATIAGAVATGVLDTWLDMDEPNPRRRLRVRRSQVLERWGKEQIAAVRHIPRLRRVIEDNHHNNDEDISPSEV